MPPKAPPPIEFSIAELRYGRKSHKAGKSGPDVRLNEGDGCMGMRPMAIPRREVAVTGKIMFGRKRFAFEVQEFDFDPKAVAALLKKAPEGCASLAPPSSSIGVQMARWLTPLCSLQVKFEDIESIHTAGPAGEEVVVFKLKQPVSCYKKPAGSFSACNLEVAEDITGGAKTLTFTATPPVVEDGGVGAGKPRLAFSAARELAAEHCPRLAALFRGQPAPPVEAPPATRQKKRPCDTPASVAKRLKKEAKGGVKLSKDDAASVDPDDAKLKLNEHVKTLADTVDEDWHDSYEETGEMLQEWLEDCGQRVQHVLRVGVELGTGFGECHEVLKQVADTWSNINAIPFRGCPSDDLGEGEGFTFEAGLAMCVHSPEAMLALAWPALLACAAADASVPDSALMQMIKDAHDHGVQEPHIADVSEDQLGFEVAVRKRVPRGRRRLRELAERRGEWKALPSTKKRHRTRRCIDRRFDGPKHLRTRDFGSDGS